MYLAKKKISLKHTFKAALASIYGLGYMRYRTLQNKLGTFRNLKLNQLSLAKRKGLSKYIDKYTLGGPLKVIHMEILQDHFFHGSYKGIRMRQGLPANGQRTRSNASTARRKFQLTAYARYLALSKK